MTLVNGWTVVTPSPTSRLIYISDSLGDDTAAASVKGGKGYYLPSDSEIGNDPIQPAGPITPYKTVEAAKNAASGLSVWYLLRRGDTFAITSYQAFPGEGTVEAPAVVCAWGDETIDRPIIIPGEYWNTSGIPWVDYAYDYKYFMHIDFNIETRAHTGGDTINPKTGILLEGCRFRQLIRALNSAWLGQMTMRRCVRDGTWDDGRNQGLFANTWSYRPAGDLRDLELLIEECVWDRNGYREDPQDATTWTSKVYNDNINFLPPGEGVQPKRSSEDRNLYLSRYTMVTLRGNIFSRDGGGGSVQMRQGGIAERNLFIFNETALGMAHPQTDPFQHKGSLSKNNVVLHDDCFLPYAGWGGGIEAAGTEISKAVLDRNIVAHFHRDLNGFQSLGLNGKSFSTLSPQPKSKLLKGLATNNVIYRKFGGVGMMVNDTVHPEGVTEAEVSNNEISISGLYDKSFLSMQGDASKPANFVYSNNKFHSFIVDDRFRWGWYANPNADWRSEPYTDGSFSEWQAAGYDTNGTFTTDFDAFKADVGWTDPERDIVSYMELVDPTYAVNEDIYLDEDAAIKQVVRQKVWEVLFNWNGYGGGMTEAQAKLAARRYHAFLTFINRAKANRKGSWDDNYTAEAVSNYIRVGFGKLTVTGDYDNRDLTTRLNEYFLSHGPVASLQITTQPVGDVSGSVLGVQPEVTLYDSNNLVTSSDNTTQVSVAIQSGSGGTLSGTTTVTVTNGVAAFTDLVLTGTEGEPYVLRFSISNPISLYVDSEDVVVSSAVVSPTTIVIVRFPVASYNNALFITQPLIVLEDSFGSLASSDNTTNVSVRIIGGLGGVLNGTTTKTAVNGIVEFNDLSLTGTTDQTYTLEFFSSELTSDTATVVLLEQVTPQPIKEVSGDLIRTGQYFGNVLSIDIDGEFNKSDFLSLRVNKTKMIGVGTQDFIIKYRNTILNNKNINLTIPEDWDLSWSFKQGPIANPNKISSCFLWVKPEKFVPSSDNTKYVTLTNSAEFSAFSNAFGAEEGFEALRSYNGFNSFIPLSFDGIDDFYTNEEESIDFMVPTSINFAVAFVAKTKNTSSEKENVVFSIGRENDDGSFQTIIDETSSSRKIKIQTQASSTKKTSITESNCYTQGDPIIVVVYRIGEYLYVSVNGTDISVSNNDKIPAIVSSLEGTFIGTTIDANDGIKKKFFSHDLYELIMLKETEESSITQDTIVKLEGYLAAKYNLQSYLPANHAYRNEPSRANLVEEEPVIPVLPIVSCNILSATATSTTPPANETTETIQVTVENSTCQWEVGSLSNWITLSASYGIGNGTVNYTVSENTGEERVGTIIITSETADTVALTITQAAGVAAVVATGGTTTDSGGYRYHTFTTNGTFSITTGGEMDILVVGGGGGGGTRSNPYGGGGGGGGGAFIEHTATLATGDYSVVIGSGGSGSTTTHGAGYSGAASSFINSTGTTISITATGGGAGGGYATGQPPTTGGSGGGGAETSSGAGAVADTYSGTGTKYGNDGGNGSPGVNDDTRAGGGGGGAGAAGSDAASNVGGNGGNGRAWLNGTTYAGGGGGASGTAGSGGSGGGGAGNANGNGVVGSANTGGGGGGGRGFSAVGGAGGSGIIIIRYAI